MGIKISAQSMTSDVTKHTAVTTAWSGTDGPATWSVTWLPGRSLTRNQAITAMRIAERAVGYDPVTMGPRTAEGQMWWGHMDTWASELGIVGYHAVAEASISPDEHLDHYVSEVARDDDEHPNAKDDMRAEAPVDGRAELVKVMEPMDRLSVLAYLSSRWPEAFDNALAFLGLSDVLVTRAFGDAAADRCQDRHGPIGSMRCRLRSHGSERDHFYGIDWSIV